MSQTFWSQYRQNPYGVKGARSARGSHSYGAIAYGATEEKPSKGLAAIVIPLAMAYLLYEGFLKPKKKTANPKRKRKNGTKKGQYRKTSRRAYAKKRNGTKKGQRRKTARRAYSKRRR